MGNLTDRQKKKIIADYLQTESYRATARLNKVSDRTVKRVVQQDDDFAQKAEQKRPKIPPICCATWNPAGRRRRKRLTYTCTP